MSDRKKEPIRRASGSAPSASSRLAQWGRKNRDSIVVGLIVTVLGGLLLAAMVPGPKAEHKPAIVAKSIGRGDIEGNTTHGMPLAEIGSASDLTIKKNDVHADDAK